jgi:ABC-type glutathione transport system ATPase component
VTIAHRLHGIAGADRVLVLEKGEVKEYDSPKVLLLRKGPAFRGMVLRAAESTSSRRPAASSSSSGGGGGGGGEGASSATAAAAATAPSSEEDAEALNRASSAADLLRRVEGGSE